MKYLISIISICLFLSSCKSPNLVGTWQIETLQISLNSFKNSDENKLISADRENWEQKMKSRNILTTYTKEGLYHSLHRNLKDSIVYDPHGVYIVIGDSLFIQDTFPEKRNYSFKMILRKDTVEFFGTEDFDSDGKVDDEYYSKQSRLKK